MHSAVSWIFETGCALYIILLASPLHFHIWSMVKESACGSTRAPMNNDDELDRMRVPRNSCDAETFPAAPVYSRLRAALIGG